MFSAFDGAGVMSFGGANQVAEANDELALLRWSASTQEELCDGLDRDGDMLDRCDDPDCWRTCTPLCPPGATATNVCSGAPSCGDGVCDPIGETCITCPDDCGACTPYCGDFACTETPATCPGDCS